MLRLVLTLALVFATAFAARAEASNLVPPAPDADAALWQTFSINLVQALQSENLGLQCSALQHAIAHADRVDVRAARFEIVRLYRDHADLRVRLTALAALAPMDDAWVQDFLRRSARYEKHERLAHLTRRAIAARAAEA